MRQPIYDLRNNFLRHVCLHLQCGAAIKGIIPPEFWVRKDYVKITYPNPEAKTIAIIQEELGGEYLQRFKAGEMLFNELPEGYQEFPIEQIKRIEVFVMDDHP